MKMKLISAALLPVLLLGCATTCPVMRADVEIDEESGPNPWTSLDFNNDPENFQFAVVTDRTGGERPGIFTQAMTKLNLMQPEFVMSVGDLIEGYNENQSEVVQEWEELEGFLDELEMPFFRVAGNHDYTNPMMSALWAERFGRSYYHFVYQDVLFLVLNSEDPAEKRPHMSDEQNAYLAKALDENPDVRWTMVFLHRPLWIEKKDVGWITFENKLQDRPYTVIAGHVHNYRKYNRFGREYYTFATTGGSSKMRGVEYGEFDHIVWITMTDEGPRIANLMLDGIRDSNIRVMNNLVGTLLPGRLQSH